MPSRSSTPAPRDEQAASSTHALPSIPNSSSGTSSGTTTPMRPGAVLERLADAASIASRICNVSGVPAASVGILHHGHLIHVENFGYVDADTRRPPTADTVYGIGSLTKGFVAASLAKLLEGQAAFGWDSPVKRILPDFKSKDPLLEELITTADLLSHRTGLWGDISHAVQGDMEFLLSPSEILPGVGGLEPVAPFRRAWIYNNWGYSVAGLVIEKLSGQPWYDYLREAILAPLGIRHTSTQPVRTSETDFAPPHAALQNANATDLPHLLPFKNSVFEAAGGLYSTVNDLITYASRILDAEREPSSSPFLRDMETIISNQVPLDDPSRDYRFYGMGWVRTQLPGVVGLQGDNPGLLPFHELPVLGKGASPMMAYYHQGAAPGYFSYIFIFPETQSAVVTLTNSMPLNDAADWIGQAYVSALFDFPETADYVSLAERSGKSKVSRVAAMKTRLEDIKDHGTSLTRPRDLFCGDYQNDAENFFIRISEHPHQEDSLQLAFQGKASQVYDLRHLDGDTFEWAPTYDEAAKRARFMIWDPEYFQIRFTFAAGENTAEHSLALTWAKLSGILPRGIRLAKKPPGTHAAPDALPGDSCVQYPFRYQAEDS